MKYPIYFFIITITFLSCKKEIDMDITDKGRQLVVNAWFQPDSLFKVYVDLDKQILEKNFTRPTDVKVLIYEDGIKIDSLIERNLSHEGIPYRYGEFSSLSKKPVKGKLYKIEAISEKYGTAVAEGFIPDTVALNSFSVDTSKIEDNYWTNYYIDEDLDTIFNESIAYNINFSFSDPKETENYYMVYINYVPDIKDYSYNSFQTTSFNYNPTYVDMYSYGSVLGGFTNIKDDDIMANGNNNGIRSASVLLLSDAVFNGKLISMELSFAHWYAYSNNKDKVIDYHRSDYAFTLVSISKDYYLFLKSVSMYSGDLNPFVEPVQVFMNIKNGKGIFLTSHPNKRIIRM